MASMALAAFGYPPNGFTVVKDPQMKKLGDMFMVKCGSSGNESGLGYYHAGVYCSADDEEIIHFRTSGAQSSSSSSSSSITASSNSISGPGVVSKVHMDVFCGKYQVVIFRKNGEIPKSFKNRVKEAMKTTPEYHFLNNNCIHFAMKLLDVDLKTIENYILQLIKPITIDKACELQPMNV